jgi:outer membrane protein TolC
LRWILRGTRTPCSPFWARGRAAFWLCLSVLAWLPHGCTTTTKNVSYVGRPNPAEDRQAQLTLDEPVDTGDEPNAVATLKPRTLADREHDPVWDLSLAEAIHLALMNNRIARTRNEFLSPGNPLLQNPEGVGSVYDPAIRETGFLFGNRGVESALSAFDPLLQASLTFGNNATIQNNPITSGGIPAGRTLNQDTAAANASITKNLSYGATVAATQTWNYSDSNQPFQLFPSVYTGNITFNYTQNLLAGGGTEFNRIAGPLGNNIQGVSGLNQGVIISRINTDITLTDFQAQIRNMVHDVEDLYWDLYLAYRNYDSLVTARNAALKIWQSVNAKLGSGLTGGGKAEEAQARETYFEARARTEAALAGPAGGGGDQGIYGLELQLRRICGLPANDGRIIRPSDEPSLAKVMYNWEVSLATAIARREELRKQRWLIKSVELQLRAAENLARPQLNFVSSYQINGFGQRLFGDNGPPGSTGAQLTNYNRVLYAADQTGWNLGVQFSLPIGLRNAVATVRNTELRLVKAHAVLDAQEIEIGNEVSSAFQKLDFLYQNIQTNYNRREAAAENLAAVKADFDVDRKPLDLYLQAQNRLTIAEITFYRSLVEYTKAQAELQMRQGTLLEYNNVYLAERESVPEAKVDATRRAWARSFACRIPEFDCVHSEPETFSTALPAIAPPNSQPFAAPPRPGAAPPDSRPAPPLPPAGPRLPANDPDDAEDEDDLTTADGDAFFHVPRQRAAQTRN